MVKMFMYGSLRIGFYNYKSFRLDKEDFIGEGKLKNAELYSLGSYPAVTEAKSGTVQGDVIDVKTGNIIQHIISMELGANYYIDLKEIEMKDGTKEIAMVFFQHFDKDRHTDKVKDGVWKKGEN